MSNKINDLNKEFNNSVAELEKIRNDGWPKQMAARATELKEEIKNLGDQISAAKQEKFMNKKSTLESSSEALARQMSETKGGSVDANTNKVLQAKAHFADWAVKRSHTDLSDYVNDLRVGVDADGGHTVTEILRSEIVKEIADLGGMLGRVTRTTVPQGIDINWPTASNTTRLASVVGEGAAVTEDTGITFDQVGVQFNKYSSGYVTVTQELLTDSNSDIIGYIRDEMRDIFARTTERVILRGGISGSAARGISQDVPDANTVDLSGDLAPEDVISLTYDLHSGYASNGVLIMNRGTLADLRTATTSGGDFLIQPDLTRNGFSTINGIPLVVSPELEEEHTDSTATREHLVLFGNPRAYQFFDVAGSMTFGTVLTSNSQVEDKVNFLSKWRFAGRLIDTNAFVMIDGRNR